MHLDEYINQNKTCIRDNWKNMDTGSSWGNTIIYVV